MSNITARYIDTCLPSYLLDGCNRPGQALCLASVGSDLATTVEELVASVDWDAGIPEDLSDGDLARAMRPALEGVDLRSIDEHGIRQDNPSDDDCDDSDPVYIYVVLEWPL